MKGDWYILEVFKESNKRIGPHTDHYNCLFVLIVRRSALDRLKKKEYRNHRQCEQLSVVHILGRKRKEYYKNSRGKRV
ncbi:hypothetical protein NC653_041799 [Populus alba x Populus x berolinensis]|uniref:Uncharacterized protein n=1 Tax=Populus alba x Populus x berolinensis TaxID=444605 RepID=A0AAD6L9M2_9ROSI|nr:hypothetical protein NC653_041799 [Populus alba x Populus x berolinensis]